MKLIGVLLAAGRGTRFDASARRSKLLEPYPPGRADSLPLVLAAARKLLEVGPVIAVVRAPSESRCDAGDENQQRLRDLLQVHGCRVLSCAVGDDLQAADHPRAPAEGIGTSIACAVRASAEADGWIVALGDMPGVRETTIAAVRQALIDGADTAAPYYRGRRGHPVGFAAVCRAELAALAGDEGARAILERHPPMHVDVEDPGILFDVDQPGDLHAFD